MTFDFVRYYFYENSKWLWFPNFVLFDFERKIASCFRIRTIWNMSNSSFEQYSLISFVSTHDRFVSTDDSCSSISNLALSLFNGYFSVMDSRFSHGCDWTTIRFFFQVFIFYRIESIINLASPCFRKPTKSEPKPKLLHRIILVYTNQNVQISLLSTGLPPTSTSIFRSR